MPVPSRSQRSVHASNPVEPTRSFERLRQPQMLGGTEWPGLMVAKKAWRRAQKHAK